MKEFILILCKPALLLCLFVFVIGGCDCTVYPTVEFYDFYLKNSGDTPIHLFLDSEGGFDPSNKVEPNKSRTHSTNFEFIEKNSFFEVTVNAGVDGQVLDSKIVTIDNTSYHDIYITWDGYGLY